MSRRKIRRLLKPALLLIGILFYHIALYQYCTLRQYPAVYQVVCEGEHAALTREDYGQICETQEKEESALCYAFWGKTEGADVEEVQWGRRSRVRVYRVRGRMDMLFHGYVDLQDTDLQGCYLDAETARELFGSTEVIGSEISCAGRQFTIRGILEGEKSLLAIRPEEGETTDRIALGKDGKEQITGAEVDAFLLRYGISGTAVHALFFRDILQIFLLLFPVGLSISLFGDLRGWSPEGIRWAVLILMFWMLLRQIEIPERMIPDKWSDLQFWRDQWESARDNIAAFVRQEKTGKELDQLICFLKGAVCAVISVTVWQIPMGGRSVHK